MSWLLEWLLSRQVRGMLPLVILKQRITSQYLLSFRTLIYRSEIPLPHIKIMYNKPDLGRAKARCVILHKTMVSQQSQNNRVSGVGRDLQNYRVQALAPHRTTQESNCFRALFKLFLNSNGFL